MLIGKTRNPRKVESCGLVWTGQEDPFTLVSDLLKDNGARLGKVDRDHGRIVAKIAYSNDSGSCKVTLQLFPQVDVCLVVATCEASRTGDNLALAVCVERLNACLNEVKLVDDKGSLDWRRRSLRPARAGGLSAGEVAIARGIGTGHT